LSFTIPPKNVPLETFESPISPIVASRVCDDCWGQIHGILHTPPPPPPPTPTLDVAMVLPLPRVRGLSRCQSEPATTATAAMPSHAITRSSPFPRRRATTTSSFAPRPSPLSPLSPHSSEPSTTTTTTSAELEAYPLRRSSAICKLTGGGRWEPKQTPLHPGYRIPGGKAPFEEEMEREEREELLRKLNPVVRDGGEWMFGVGVHR
jgi:hypothetical protein